MTRPLIRWHHAPLPFQTWKPFPDDAIVKVYNCHGESNIGVVKDFWWGYEEELGGVGEGVITKCIRLDKPKEKTL